MSRKKKDPKISSARPLSSPSGAQQMLFALAVVFSAVAFSYPNGAPDARLPSLGWSSWTALGPGASAPVFDFCDEFSVLSAVDAFFEVGLYDAGYRTIHLDGEA
jgi:hypothetical protein